MFDLLSPNMVEYENSVAGSLFIDPSCLLEITEIISPQDLCYEAPRAVLEAAIALNMDNAVIDPLTIQEKAAKLGVQLSKDYIFQAMNNTVTSAHAAEYAKLVRKSSQNRRLYGLTQEMQERLVEHAEPNEIISEAYTRLETVATSGSSREIVSSMDAISEWYNKRSEIDSGGSVPAVKTGFDSLDSALGGGMTNGGLYIIGARPGVGKTTVGLAISDNIAARGEPVLFVSMEMSMNEISAKRVARVAGIPYHLALIGPMSGDDYRKALLHVDKLCEASLYLADKPQMTVQDILFAAQRIKGRKGLAAVCVDYLNIIKAPPSKGSRYEKFTEISNDLKRMAGTLNVPVICLAQLNRENEGRSNKRPILSDLRDTGAIEQDANAVIFLHREAYYNRDDEDRQPYDAEELELIIAKCRNGTPGKVAMAWYGATGRIMETRQSGKRI